MAHLFSAERHSTGTPGAPEARGSGGSGAPHPARHALLSRPARQALGLLALAALAFLPTGCASEPGDETGEALAPESFVAIMVALRHAEREAIVTDSARPEFERRKEAILAEHGATEEQLRDFVRLHQRDFALMNAIWDTIAQRLKYVPEPLGADESMRIDERR